MIDTFKLKQMLGLYLGARVLVGDEIRVLHGVVGDSMVLIDETYGHLSEYPVTDLGVRIQLLLRPVTSITEAEAMELATVLGWEFDKIEIPEYGVVCIRMIAIHDDIAYAWPTLYLKEDWQYRFDRYEHGTKSHLTLILWFARKGFDLNGWIKSGLGVTKLKSEV